MIAEAVVSFVIEKIAELLVDEGVFLHEVRGQVEWVEAELRSMWAFLKDADTKQKDERVTNWVADVRDAAYNAEDVIDNFVLKIEQGRRRGLVGFIKRFAPFSDEPIARRQLGKDIQEIKNKLLEISKRRKTYGIENLSKGGEGSSSMSEILREQRWTSPLLEDTEVVGFQEDMRTLVARLIEGESRRCMISVVGMGGLGKTTLTRKVYNHDDVKKHFDCCAWIYVSQEYDVRGLLLNIMRCFMIPIAEQISIVRLREKLFLHLQSRRYFVVVDDIWKTEAWDALAAAFPDMNNGSRAILTTRTRNRDVALHADIQSCVHDLKLLKTDESWKLFCQKIFFKQDSCHTPDSLGQLQGTQASMNYRPSNTVMNPFCTVGSNQPPRDPVYLHWPSPAMMYAQSCERFRQAVFQAPFYQQPLSFDYSQHRYGEQKMSQNG
ncbi:putative disease resistance protein At1g50180 [Magnolia sinica]|uniref:putative disease resistance protein At1g50180 n=1 Tax=Magnolia sinica TaxID=86752 RepID=UPI00265B2E89|nr:putative disease resistance protein At1g50180 [Magnolia sinica]